MRYAIVSNIVIERKPKIGKTPNNVQLRLKSACNSAFSPVRIEQNLDFVPYEDLDPMHAHFARQVGNDLITLNHLDPEHGIWQRLGNYSGSLVILICLLFFHS
jgi:hypothetical protein